MGGNIFIVFWEQSKLFRGGNVNVFFFFLGETKIISRGKYHTRKNLEKKNRFPQSRSQQAPCKQADRQAPSKTPKPSVFFRIGRPPSPHTVLPRLVEGAFHATATGTRLSPLLGHFLFIFIFYNTGIFYRIGREYACYAIRRRHGYRQINKDKRGILD